MEGAYPGQERRKYRRLDVNFTIIYQIEKPVVVRMMVGWDREIDAVMLDLSEGGMSILTSYDIPPATLLSMRFVLIDLSRTKESRIKNMKLAGLVRYSTVQKNGEHRLGICFTDIRNDDREAIREFVRLASFKREPPSAPRQ